MGLAATEKELAEKASRFLKAELKRANVTYAELARRLEAHGLPGETEASVSSKLGRGTFAATFWLASLAVLELEGMRLADL
jgi:hypothetical protein